jgi:sulfide:quinone oxidoreductase
VYLLQAAVVVIDMQNDFAARDGMFDGAGIDLGWRTFSWCSSTSRWTRRRADGPEAMLPYDVLHAVPRQSAPDWIKFSPLSTGDATGYVDIDKHTMQHVRYPNVFSLGDAGSSPNSKTGAAIRKQAPVVVDNIDAFLKRQPLPASYDGYSSCPIVTSSHAMLLAEFDYDLQLQPSFPLLDPTKPHHAYWYLKKYGLPFMYWNLMLKGLV